MCTTDLLVIFNRLNPIKRIIRPIGLFVVLASFAAAVLPINAQSSQNRSTISGYVFGPQRLPVEEVAVELLNEYNSLIQRVKTDGSGRYLFTGLALGRYTIRVSPLGTDLQEQSVDVEIYGISIRQGRSSPDNVQKDIYLRPRRSGNPGPAGSVFVQEVPDDAIKVFEKAVSELHDKNNIEAIEDLKKLLNYTRHIIWRLNNWGRSISPEASMKRR